MNQLTDPYASIRELLIVTNSSKDEIEQIKSILSLFLIEKNKNSDFGFNRIK